MLISGDNVGTVGREEDAAGAACAAGAVASGEAIAVDTSTGDGKSSIVIDVFRLWVPKGPKWSRGWIAHMV